MEFRKWATKILREYITTGYVINKKQVAKHYESFLAALDDFKKMLPNNKNIDNQDIMEINCNILML